MHVVASPLVVAVALGFLHPVALADDDELTEEADQSPAPASRGHDVAVIDAEYASVS